MPRGESDKRNAEAALFREIVDQFVARPLHPAADIEQFETLAGGFIDVLDTDVVAERAVELCRHPDTPRGVIARLLDKGGRVSRIAIEYAPAIHAGLARALAEHGSAELAVAIARRSSLERKIVACLASRGESEVLCALAANRRLHLDQASRRALLQAARDDPRLARILLDRSDLGLDPEALFLAADPGERSRILLEATTRALIANGPEHVARPSPALAEEIDACAIARDLEGLAEALAEALDCRKSRARAILMDRGGEALALALVALCVSEDTAIRIFLGADRDAPDVERIRSLVALTRSTPPRAAQRLVAAMTGSLRQEKERAAAASARPGAVETKRRRKPKSQAAKAKA
ncbi:DUF2336 domain-containing protein [Methylosinus sp. Ce-a6]|uniref:DUF2336 domain-containing protein n=1 Tax=Methylosinus sp. Ce-a6 TaxID=2172005 RepID=UPI00135B6403|nr:DUF2336 domain-containing protein [Methylosinus sp. Ce-a6]